MGVGGIEMVLDGETDLRVSGDKLWRTLNSLRLQVQCRYGSVVPVTNQIATPPFELPSFQLMVAKQSHNQGSRLSNVLAQRRHEAHGSVATLSVAGYPALGFVSYFQRY